MMKLSMLTDVNFHSLRHEVLTAEAWYLVGVPPGAETVNSGSAEPDQVSTCEGNKSSYYQRAIGFYLSAGAVTPSGLRTSNFH